MGVEGYIPLTYKLIHYAKNSLSYGWNQLTAATFTSYIFWIQGLRPYSAFVFKDHDITICAQHDCGTLSDLHTDIKRKCVPACSQWMSSSCRPCQSPCGIHCPRHTTPCALEGAGPSSIQPGTLTVWLQCVCPFGESAKWLWPSGSMKILGLWWYTACSSSLCRALISWSASCQWGLFVIAPLSCIIAPRYE